MVMESGNCETAEDGVKWVMDTVSMHKERTAMFATAQEFINFVTVRKTAEDSREGFRSLLEQLGHPERQLKCLHVAGTNGKGSTTDYLRSILQSHGYKVGSFTSPHLIVHNDRIRINNENIPDDKLLYYGNKFEPYYEKFHLSMFQIDMLISVYYFLDSQVDYVVYEVGMGGRLDTTNIIMPLVSVITNIGFDHMAYLGDTLEAIAYEKAGIIKEGVPAFTGETKKRCLQVFDRVAEEKHTSVTRIRAGKGEIRNGHCCFSYGGYDIALGTLALYQVKNATLALAVAEYLRKNHIIELDRQDIVKGLESTLWNGRFEVVNEKPLIIVDGAHNEHGVTAIIDSVKALPRPLCIVASILADKQYDKMIRTLRTLCDELVVTTFVSSRSTPIEKLAEGHDVTAIEDYRKALEYAADKYADGTVLATGSLYFVSEVRALYKGGNI